MWQSHFAQVRDLTQAEEHAVVAACARQRVRCVGCNLGRTAEFTSKIILAIHGHRMNARLGRAASALAAMSANGCLTKQRPARLGGVTWDGKRKRSEPPSELTDGSGRWIRPVDAGAGGGGALDDTVCEAHSRRSGRQPTGAAARAEPPVCLHIVFGCGARFRVTSCASCA
jgi:hypothetical protein